MKRVYILMVLAAVCWSGAFIAGKFAVPYIPTCTLTFGRFFVASIILYLVKKYMDEKKTINVQEAADFCVRLYGCYIALYDKFCSSKDCKSYIVSIGFSRSIISPFKSIYKIAFSYVSSK